MLFKFPSGVIACWMLFGALVSPNLCAVGPLPSEQEPKYWQDLAQDALKEVLEVKQNNNVAKNVILFLGDGMGIPTITAARIYKGQKNNQPGEEAFLEWDKFKDVALIKTYNVDTQVADSAGSATAFLCGVKTNVEIVGLSAKAIKNNCASSKGAEVKSIMDWSQEANKATGFVTTSRITHASPAALYAHSPQRDWESNEEIPANADCKDIARQLVQDEPGRNIKVILGGGSRHFFPNTTTDAVSKEKNYRTDGKDLVQEWKDDKETRGSTHKYVTNLKEFNSVNVKNTDYLLGIFGHSHVSYELERNKNDDGVPSLVEMTDKAIDLLSKDPNGYFLFVEGARIDHAHHDNLAMHALEETVQFDEAVKVALSKTSPEDTLIVVTADHDHGMKLAGKPPRGSNILGIAEKSMADGLPYTTLMYTTGPGYVEDSVAARKNFTNFKLDKDYAYLAPVPRNWSAHGGEDVQAYAHGPMSHLFRGVQEQHYIAHAMAYASCVGQNKEHCQLSCASSITSCYIFGTFNVTFFLLVFNVLIR